MIEFIDSQVEKLWDFKFHKYFCERQKNVQESSERYSRKNIWFSLVYASTYSIDLK